MPVGTRNCDKTFSPHRTFSSRNRGPRGDEPVLQDIFSSTERASYRQWLRLFNGDFLPLRLIWPHFSFPLPFCLFIPVSSPAVERFRDCNWILRYHHLQPLCDLVEPNFFYLLRHFLFSFLTLNSICMWKNAIQNFLLILEVGLFFEAFLTWVHSKPTLCHANFIIWPLLDLTNAFVFSMSLFCTIADTSIAIDAVLANDFLLDIAQMYFLLDEKDLLFDICQRLWCLAQIQI